VAFVPKSILNVNRATSPSVIVKPMKGAHLSKSDSVVLRAEMRKSDSVVIGPGIGRNSATLSAAAALISHASRSGIRIVIDADALAAVARHRPELGPQCVLTPNDSEFLMLSGKRIDRRDLAKRIAGAVALARKLHTNILLKGHETVITDGRRVKVVRSRTAALATMGTGDVLSGIIAGYAARSEDLFSAAVAGAYLHSAIGDALYRRKGNHIIASDVVDYIPRAMRRIEVAG
jgi:NAD(P)H-hydrate epimerase